MSLTFGQGSTTFTMSDDFTRLVREAIDKTMPGIVDKVEAATERVFAQAVERAPVKTGAFKASFVRETLVAPDLSSIRGRVFSTSAYGKYVKSLKLPGSGSAFVELLRKPMEAEGVRLVADVRAVLDRLGT